MTAESIDDAFPSKYLKASDLPEEGTLAATIEDVAIEEIGKNRKKSRLFDSRNWTKRWSLTKPTARPSPRSRVREGSKTGSVKRSIFTALKSSSRAK